MVARGGNVMLPVDASGRLLELLLVLEKLMQDNKWVQVCQCNSSEAFCTTMCVIVCLYVLAGSAQGLFRVVQGGRCREPAVRAQW